MCICSPGLVELVKSNLAPDFPLFHATFAPHELQLKQTVTVAAEAWAEAMADAGAEEGAEASSSEGTKESPKLKFLDYNHEIKSGEKYFYSILVDETADLGKSEQLSLSISYLNNGVKKERFLMFIEVTQTVN